MRITLGTGGTSGTYYPLGVAMTEQIFSDVDGVSQARAVSTGASVTNAQELGEGKYDGVLVQNDIAYYAVNGKTLDAFEDGNTVDNMTKAMFENKDDLEAAHDRGKDITLEGARDGMSIDLHPGAEKYYEEQDVSND